ncbi:MAG: hypothetical protein RIT04_631 [Candidatus Parcubacteria bacterium]|jgi:type IV pilus assembly protein PilA
MYKDTDAIVDEVIARGNAVEVEDDFLGIEDADDERGFTLIEVLVVIGIIAVLAAVVLVAVNPARQFKLARDAQRVSNVNSLLNTVGQNIAEHHGQFICGSDTTATAIPQPGTVMRSAGGGFDIGRCIVPAYISAIPFDPGTAGTYYYTSPTDYDTGYTISQDEQGRITIAATGEITPTISVTR